MAISNVDSMGFKLKLAVAGHAGIKPQQVRDSFLGTQVFGQWTTVFPNDWEAIPLKGRKRKHKIDNILGGSTA